MKELKIIEPTKTMKYDGKNIYFKSNLGDIVMEYKEAGNYLQRGLRGNDLFVSIIGLGSFGFEITKQEKAIGYVAEKLNLRGEPTLSKFTDLLNGVIKELNIWE